MSDGRARSGKACAAAAGLPRAMFAAFIAFAALASSPGQALAQIGAIISASEDNGFARIVLEMDQAVGHNQSIADGILVIALDVPIDVDVSKIVPAIPDYLVGARLDPSGDSLRLALAQTVTVNTIAAGRRLYIDLLPSTWGGPPPGLPESVVTELIYEAEAAAAEAVEAKSRQAPERPPLIVRSGRYPTFSRIVFDWDDPTPTVLSRNGDRVSLAFEREADPDLSQLNADPPPFLVGAKARSREGGLEIELEVAEGSEVRGFREGVTYIVDLAGPRAPFGEGGGAEVIGPGGRPDLPSVATGVDGVRLPADSDDEVAAAPPTPSPESLVAVSVTPLGEAEKEAKTDTANEVAARSVPGGQEVAEDGRDEQVPKGDAPDQRPEKAESESGGAAASGEPAPAVDEAIVATDTPQPVTQAPSGGSDAEEVPAEPPAVIEGRRTVAATAKMVGSTLQIAFPFPRQVAAAAFQRGNTLWVVFDTDAVLEVSSVRKLAGEVVKEVQVVRSDNMQVVRLALTGPFLASAATRTHDWIVSIGDLMLDPTTPLILERALRSDGRSKVVVQLPQYGRVHWLADREFADQLAVVTAFGPPRGLIKRQEFVEFTALPTAHGLVIKPNADDLAVRLIQGDVVLTRDDGLTLSAGRWPVFIPGRETMVDGSRPGFVDFEGWNQGGPQQLRANAQRLLRTISESLVVERVGPRLELARLYLAHELAAEALAIMKIAESEDAAVANDPVYRAMRGVANHMLGRNAEARADLAVHGLTQDPHSALWRGLVEFSDGHFREAHLEIESGLAALDSYPQRHQVRFRLASARSALEISDLETASRDLDAIIGAQLDKRAAGETMLLRAWLAELLGATDDAALGYERAATSSAPRVAVEAQFRGTALALREGRITPINAIDALERLAVIWRGDSLEIAILRRLSQLYRDRGDYRDALETMKTAVLNHEDNERARFIAEDMSELFDQIFLEGGGDQMAPIAALGLYYDFRELTPVGRRGDEMIRKLAHRLVEVDLLDQAAELLNYQVSNRLVGVAKAQVATDLSLIYLTAHQPDNALRALRQSRQAVLPEELDRKRSLLEARALSELGRVEVAVELLSGLSGDDIERAKADALWTGERWQRAGEQIERMLGTRWRENEPLSDAERFDVMRIAISYVFAGDTLGLDRLRRKFTSKMAESPDASAFNLVTHEVDTTNVAFSDLAAEIAQVDTLEAFLQDFKERYGKDDSGDAGS